MSDFKVEEFINVDVTLKDLIKFTKHQLLKVAVFFELDVSDSLTQI